MKGERSRHTLFVLPPAVERVGKAWELIDSHAIVVCADYEQASLWADAAPPCRRAISSPALSIRHDSLGLPCAAQERTRTGHLSAHHSPAVNMFCNP